MTSFVGNACRLPLGYERIAPGAYTIGVLPYEIILGIVGAVTEITNSLPPARLFLMIAELVRMKYCESARSRVKAIMEESLTKT